MRFRFLYNGDRAFKDNDRFIVLDIPKHYEGSRMYRTNERYSEKEIKLKANQQANLFIAIKESVENFLPSDFKFTQEKISVC